MPAILSGAAAGILLNAFINILTPVERKREFTFLYRYPAVILVTTASFAVCNFKYGYSHNFYAYSAMACFAAAASFIDLQHGIIPDALNFVGFIAGIGFGILKRNPSDSILGAVLGLLVMATIYFISRGGMGAGDVKFTAVLGLFLGFPLIIPALIFSFITGALIGAGLVIGGRKSMKDTMPFGPFLGAGTLISAVWGNDLIYFYLSLFI
ncbi:prepilin peptidase [Thermosediminibacter litoriperuensis]|uniref:Leader peptidase (Prepilin peptidase)/N-methyltransferase n=1 Tax=Thermosediminibacter litoriperuensis TaxID=291989 RepID=A0A5S5AL58_9FIRM|nr:A24 family peptidase [Thermosediminibacter litoriperuensis]TYP51615.1 leader peptidase (prepilin peptidase)/N-methyltransferase [Thermosediminibacter litoriperuensis]